MIPALAPTVRRAWAHRRAYLALRGTDRALDRVRALTEYFMERLRFKRLTRKGEA